METSMPTLLEALVACAVVVVGILVSALVFMLVYNYAVVQGVSADPAPPHKPRLRPLEYTHALALMLLVSIFLSPTVVVGARQLR